MKGKVVCLTIDNDVLTAFKQICNDNHLSVQAGMRRLVSVFVQNNGGFDFIPSTDDKKRSRVQFLISKVEENDLIKASRSLGVKPSEFLRACINNFNRSAEILNDEEIGGLKELLHQLNRLSNNINQIAKQLNIEAKGGKTTKDIGQLGNMANLNEVQVVVRAGIHEINVLAKKNKHRWATIVGKA